MICQKCKEEFNSLTGLHRHLKKHDLTQAEYYHYFNPRYDKYDNFLIKYKDYKSYHANDFNSRENFLDWAAQNYQNQEVKDYCFGLLEKRKENKGIQFIPSQAEFKSMVSPSWFGYEKMFGREKFIEKSDAIGLKNRFPITSFELKPGDLEIWIDTREQSKLSFENANVIDRKLIVGDYTTTGDFYCDVFVERKSLMDLAGTLTSGSDRFKREVARAKELGLYLVVVVESPYSEAMDYSPSNSFAKKTTGIHLFHEIRALMQEFDNIQFLFAVNRRTAANYIEKIFRMGEQVKMIDLELQKDRGLL